MEKATAGVDTHVKSSVAASDKLQQSLSQNLALMTSLMEKQNELLSVANDVVSSDHRTPGLLSRLLGRS